MHTVKPIFIFLNRRFYLLHQLVLRIQVVRVIQKLWLQQVFKLRFHQLMMTMLTQICRLRLQPSEEG
jgi:hypothetical protein